MSNNQADACAELETRIPELPSIMRRHGWGVASMLMHKWLNSGANSNPEHGVHDTITVRMDWVLHFNRALAVYQAAKNGKVWVNEAAQNEIIRKLINIKSRLPAVVGEKLEIGNVGEGQMRHPGNVVQFHDDWHVQFREVKQSLLNPLIDDLYGALGNFSFYYLVKGWIERLPGKDGQPRYKVTINKVGVYVRDSYDFNDKPWEFSQPLGVFGCSPLYIGNGLKLQGSSKRYYVNNSDFREWRRKYGKGHGGDFLVFSDIKVFDTNDSFEFSK
jgi:hypothetical protein